MGSPPLAAVRSSTLDGIVGGLDLPAAFRPIPLQSGFRARQAARGLSALSARAAGAGQHARMAARDAPGPDRNLALAQYRARAGIYDLELALLEPMRRLALQRLAPQRGETVIDMACGTGLSLAALAAAVGPHGRVIGIEQSPEMIARARVTAARWRQVELVEAPMERARLSGRADAALCHFTHDVLQRADAVRNLLHHLRPGARIVCTGLAWAPRWAPAVNAAVLLGAWRSTTTLEGLARPWALLEAHIGPMASERYLFGGVYLAHGRVPRH